MLCPFCHDDFDEDYERPLGFAIFWCGRCRTRILVFIAEDAIEVRDALVGTPIIESCAILPFRQRDPSRGRPLSL